MQQHFSILLFTQGLACGLFQRLMITRAVTIFLPNSGGFFILALDKSSYMKIREVANSFFKWQP